VETGERDYFAQTAIVCLPPQLVPGLIFSPALPPDLYRAFAAMQTGNTMKVQAVYDRPFWRDNGLSGNGISWDGPQTFTYDNTLGDGPGVLLGFLTARRATECLRLPLAERKQAVLQAWADVFGPEALEPIDYIEHDWTADQFTRGGYGCHFPPGAWCELGSAFGGESMPRFQNVWWAASDLAKDWNGYLEGALFAGEQAAEEVAASLTCAAIG
jgi:monoamine oxidase